MSRSRKKTPIYKVPEIPSAKKLANRHYRRQKKEELKRYSENTIAQSAKAEYKKYFDSWDIYDWILFDPKSSAIARYEQGYYLWETEKYHINSVEDYLNKVWKPIYVRK